MISIIVPAYNESETLAQWLTKLFASVQPEECIIVDASEAEAYEKISAQLSTQLGSSVQLIAAEEKGRARQMNQGALVSRGSILLFLHADTLLPETALVTVQAAVKAGWHWGWFKVSFDNRRWPYRMIAAMMNWRTSMTGVATGDQAMFMTRAAFDLVGGFDKVNLMEDVMMSKKLKTIGLPVRLDTPVRTAARRWEKKGVIRTVCLMWALRLALFLGVPTQHLAKWYR